MTRETLWEIYTRKNPKFVDSGATFTADGLKKFFWDLAHYQGVENGRALELLHPSKTPESKADPMATFRSVFGDSFKL